MTSHTPQGVFVTVPKNFYAEPPDLGVQGRGLPQAADLLQGHGKAAHAREGLRVQCTENLSVEIPEFVENLESLVAAFQVEKR
mmetsp:Transcript_13680/g.30138  ORF Transcript_13680/g.30138 Transcript_13680/m.30138 type:complete len:83 (-) Transcript_13680:412-660(-)